jgi:hypothetical protein
MGEFNVEVITHQEIEGFHKYSKAPAPVRFLAYNHRHIFTIRAGWKVEHDDRDKEIFIQQKLIEEVLIEWYGLPCQFKGMSCEMIASELLKHFAPDGMTWCEVLEDGKGGAKVKLVQPLNI